MDPHCNKPPVHSVECKQGVESVKKRAEQQSIDTQQGVGPVGGSCLNKLPGNGWSSQQTSPKWWVRKKWKATGYASSHLKIFKKNNEKNITQQKNNKTPTPSSQYEGECPKGERSQHTFFSMNQPPLDVSMYICLYVVASTWPLQMRVFIAGFFYSFKGKAALSISLGSVSFA